MRNHLKPSEEEKQQQFLHEKHVGLEMNTSQKNRKFDIPQAIITEIENLKSEVQALRSTVASKSAAVVILREQLASSTDPVHASLQNQASQTQDVTSCNSPDRSSNTTSSSVLVELLSASKRENIALKQDIMNLRCKLHDAQADLKVLRSEATHGVVISGAGPLQQQWRQQERLHLICGMEALTAKVSTLESDVRCLTSEKEELLRERQHLADTLTLLKTQQRKEEEEAAAAAIAYSLTPAIEDTEVSAINAVSNDEEEGSVSKKICSVHRTCINLPSNNRVTASCSTQKTSVDVMCIKCQNAVQNSVGIAVTNANLNNEEIPVTLYSQGYSTVEQSKGVELAAMVDCSPQAELIHKNRVLAASLQEAREELRHVRAELADYELLSSLQRAAHSSHSRAVLMQHQNMQGLDHASQPPCVSVADVATGQDSASRSFTGPGVAGLPGSNRTAEVASTSAPSLVVADDNATKRNVPVSEKQRVPEASTDIEKKQLSSSAEGRDRDNPVMENTPITLLTESVKSSYLTNAVIGSKEMELNRDVQMNGNNLEISHEMSSNSTKIFNGPHSVASIMSSDCLQEIIPIDQIDSYVKVKKCQMQRTSSKAHAEIVQKVESSDCAENTSSVICSQQDKTDGFSEPVNVGVEGRNGLSRATTCSAGLEDADLFSDYDSDDDQLEAQLQQWQISADGLLNQTKMK